MMAATLAGAQPAGAQPAGAQPVVDAVRSASHPSGLTVGIDVGGTKTSCVVTDSSDRVLHREVIATQAGRLADELISLVRRVSAKVANDGAGDPVTAVGIAVPGHVEPRTGRVGLAVNLGGADLPLGSTIADSVGVPCYVEHDARAAAAWLIDSDVASGDQLEAIGDLAYISVGTGISAGIVLDGHVLRGANGLAGEIGHASAEPDGARCPCGLNGCLETVAAGPAIARLARDAVTAGRSTSLPSDATAADVFRAAAAGDQLATELAATIAGRLARAIRGLVLTLGVRRVIVGGGVAAAGDALLEPLMSAISGERAASPLVEAAFAGATLELLSPEVEAGARGAAAIARRRAIAEQREGVGER